MNIRILSRTAADLIMPVVFVGLMTASLSAQGKPGEKAEASHDLVGEIKKFDSATKKLTLKTAEGGEATIRVTEKTTVHGLKEAGTAAALAGKEGSHVVVHYTGVGTERTALSIDHIGKDAPKVLEGTVVGLDKAGRSVVVKTASGAEETVHLSEHATIDTAKGSVRLADFTAQKGERITVRYTEEGTRKVGHFFKVIAVG